MTFELDGWRELVDTRLIPFAIKLGIALAIIVIGRWVARGMITDLLAEKELFTLQPGQLSQQHNLLTTTTWYKLLERSESRDLDDDQKKILKDNSYSYWLNLQKKAHDVLRLIPGLEFE